MFCRDLEDKMQRQTVDLHGGRKWVHPMHDFQALHDLDQLDAHVRTDDGNVMGGICGGGRDTRRERQRTDRLED